MSSDITCNQTKWFKEPLQTSAKTSESEGLSASLSDVETATLMCSQADCVSFLLGCLFLFTQHLAECLACGMLLSCLVAEWTHTYIHSHWWWNWGGAGSRQPFLGTWDAIRAYAALLLVFLLKPETIENKGVYLHDSHLYVSHTLGNICELLF